MAAHPRLRHLLLTTVEDPYDSKSWSGIPFSLRTALEQQVDRLTVFRPGPPARTPMDVVKRLWYGGQPPRYPLALTRATLRNNARAVRAEIARTEPDAVLSISFHSVVGLGPVGCPVFLFSDAPWMAWHEAYRGTVSRPVQLERVARDEAAAANEIAGVCFGSDWAAASAVRLFGLSPERVHRTPLGANWTPQGTRGEVLARVAGRGRSELKLLFVGKDWERKGGPLAVEVARELRARGVAARLEVVGCRPELAADTHSFVTVHGPLYQSDPAQSAVLAELFASSHFLLVPTLAECFGIVFAEAQAFALPPVARAVQALPTVVEDQGTGLLLAPEAQAGAYVERILALWADKAAYEAMAARARLRFEQTLNWDACAAGLIQVMSLALAQPSR